jgi:hypothetical protein
MNLTLTQESGKWVEKCLLLAFLIELVKASSWCISLLSLHTLLQRIPTCSHLVLNTQQAERGKGTCHHYGWLAPHSPLSAVWQYGPICPPRVLMSGPIVRAVLAWTWCTWKPFWGRSLASCQAPCFWTPEWSDFLVLQLCLWYSNQPKFMIFALVKYSAMGTVAQVVGCLPSNHEALSSDHRTPKS